MTGYSIEHLELKGRGCEIRRGAPRQLQVGYMPSDYEHAARTSTRPQPNGKRAASQRTGGELELVGRLPVGIAGGAVGGGVVLEVEEKGEHCDDDAVRSPVFYQSAARELAAFSEIGPPSRLPGLGSTAEEDAWKKWCKSDL